MPGKNNVEKARQLGQSIWLDFISREILDNGELKRLVELGVAGVTSNPTIFEKSISSGSLYDADLLAFARRGDDSLAIYEGLALNDIARAADILLPVYERTGGADGFVSIEVNPGLAHDTAATIAEARRLSRALARKNILIKVPATPEGIPAIRTLIGEGISVNVTLIFSLDAYKLVAEAYVDGLEDYQESGKKHLARISSVASFFVSRVDTIADKLLGEVAAARTDDARRLKGTIAIANARLAYQEYKRIFGSARFKELAKSGARTQRTLWASTSTKNPAFPDTLYMDELMGPETVNTVPPATLDAFLDHGKIADRIGHDPDEARANLARLRELGVSYEAMTAELVRAGVKAFADSFDSLIKNIEKKRAALLAGSGAR
ncbi:MAG: transaldolase [SAR202 cluster bacterium]|nr:transaldolase [SAR202 cluster bacterium]